LPSTTVQRSFTSSSSEWSDPLRLLLHHPAQQIAGPDTGAELMQHVVESQLSALVKDKFRLGPFVIELRIEQLRLRIWDLTLPVLRSLFCAL